jgi:hypothetical protein
MHLLHSTRDETVNRTHCEVIEAFETTFPHRVRGYYVQGSYADQSEVTASDLDLVILFADFHSEADHAAARQLARRCEDASGIELDIEIMAEDEAARGVEPTFELGSILVYGQDVREDLPLMPIEEWAQDRVHSSYWRVARLFTRPEIITSPLAYPDSADEFYGYARRMVRLRDGSQVPSTRNLIRLTGWAATARLAYECGVYVGRKSDCHAAYRAYIGDKWSSLLEDIYTLCRGRWSYLIPDDPTERGQLRAICARTLGFENAFLVMYTRYLIAELRGTDAAAEAALRVLMLAPYHEAGVITALEDLAQRAGDHLRAAAQTVLAKQRTPAEGA